MVDIERLVPEDHRVRDVWAFVETPDLGMFYARIKTRGDTPGWPAADARGLLALWLCATIDRIGPARAGAVVRAVRDLPLDLRRRWGQSRIAADDTRH